MAESSFFSWRRRLRADAATAGFVEARVVDQDRGDAADVHVGGHAAGVMIELAGGRRVLVRRGFDRQALLDVIQVLEGMSGGPQTAHPELAEGAWSGRRRGES